MITSSETNSTNFSIDWSDEEYSFKEFSKVYNLPAIGKIVKGQLENANVSLSSSPDSKTVCLWSKFKVIKILANCVKFKDCRSSLAGSLCSKTITFGPKFSIPQNYDGYFEILSEEGRSVKCIENVAELAKKFPETCLIRESIKVNLCKEDENESVLEKTRTLFLGDTLKLIDSGRSSPLIYSPSNNCSLSSVSSPSSNCSFCHHSQSPSNSSSLQKSVPNEQSNRYRYLKCQTSKGETIFLNLKSKGKFSPIAKEESISGVHSVSSLLNKRLPLMVRLVHGSPIPDFKSWVPEMRLLEVFEEEIFLAMPLNKDYTGFGLIQVPQNSTFKLAGPKNFHSIPINQLTLELNSQFSKSKLSCLSCIQVIDNQVINKDLKVFSNKETSDPCKFDSKSKIESTSFFNKKDADQNNQSNSDNESGYDEIDQIYDYVRGFAPLPEKVRILKENFKPKPPPIETIPRIRRLSYPTIVCDLVYKANPNSHRKATEKSYDRDHIYERIGYASKSTKRNQVQTNGQTRLPMRSNSTGKMYNLPLNGPNYFLINHHLSKPKLFVKSVSPVINGFPLNQRKLSKYAKNLSQCANIVNYKEPLQSNKWTFRPSGYQSLISSPLFNIRYKSLNNLHFVSPFMNQQQFFRNSNNTIDSSNSGCRVSSKSENSCDSFKNTKPKNRRLSRPLSFSNLFWDITKNEASPKTSLEAVPNQFLKKRLDFNKLGFNSSINNKKLGTLYL